MKRFILTAAILLAGFTGVADDLPDSIKVAPGAACYVWKENVSDKPAGEPVSGFVDTAKRFHAFNIQPVPELEKLTADSSHLFIFWEGFLRIQRSSNYTFVIHGNPTVYSVKFFVNGRKVVEVPKGEVATASGTIFLPVGMAKVRVYFNNFYCAPRHAGFKLFYAQGSSSRLTEITPATLYHETDQETE